MNAIVIEHVKVEELPDAWRAKLSQPANARVTVRIEQEESPGTTSAAEVANDDDLLFGMWRDREDMADVPGYVRAIRAPRFNDESKQRGTK